MVDRPAIYPGPDPESGLIIKIARWAFWLNFALALMKTSLALVTNSLAVTAGAIDSGTDAVASLVLYGGLKLSLRKSPSFPLGLYKVENLISVLIAIIILFSGYEIFRRVLRRGPAVPDISGWVVGLLFLGTIATGLFSQYVLRVSRRTGSPTLRAEGLHRRVDMLTSLVVLAAVLPGYLGWPGLLFGWNLDGLAAVIVLVFIAWAGWDLLADGMRVLLDASIDFETLDRVRRILETNPLVVEVRSLIGRNAGRFRFLEATVVLRTDDFQKAHQIREDLERAVREKVPRVEGVLITYEPRQQNYSRIAIPLDDSSENISRHFGEAPFFAILNLQRGNGSVESREIRENPYREVEIAKGLRVAEWLVEQNVDEVLTREDLSRKGPGYVLGQAGVKTTIIPEDNLSQALIKILGRGKS